MSDKSNIAAALYGFAAWLTTRDDVIPVGATADAAPMAELVEEFCELRGVDTTGCDVLNWEKA